MKTIFKYALFALSFGVLLNVILGTPNSKWNDIQAGMKASEITALLGRPNHDQLKVKNIQIWNRGGFIRTSSLAVLYNDPNNPETSTKILRSDIWIWQRI